MDFDWKLNIVTMHVVLKEHMSIQRFHLSVSTIIFFLLFFEFGFGSELLVVPSHGHISVGGSENVKNITTNLNYSGNSENDKMSSVTKNFSRVDFFQNNPKTEEFSTMAEELKHLASSDDRIENEEFVISTGLVIRLAQCRANCLDKFGIGESQEMLTLSLNVKNSSISECWNTCHQLESGSNEDKIQNYHSVNLVCLSKFQPCLMGCQESCRFHQFLHSQNSNNLESKNLISSRNLLVSSSTSKPTKNSTIDKNYSVMTAIGVETTLSISHSSQPGPLSSVIHWPMTELPNDHQHLIYSLIHQDHSSSSSSWEILGTQTISNEIIVPTTLIYTFSNFRILAVNSYGLVQVFSFPNSPTEEKNHDDENEKKNQDFWNLRLNSLVNQKFLVVTEVKWDFPSVEELISSNPIEVEELDSRGKDKKSMRMKSKKNSGSKSTDPNKKLRTSSNDEKDSGRIQNDGKSRNEKPSENDEGGSDEKQKKTFTFLLSWEVYGGLVCGHLVTKMNVVTISLWPETSYTLQVGLIDVVKLKLGGNESIISELDVLLSSEGELPVVSKSNSLTINTSLANYPLVNKSFGERKRSAQQLISAHQKRDSSNGTSTSVERKSGGESVSGKSIRLCNWNVQHHPIATETELRACVLIWTILILCLIIIFLMFLYFSFAVYLAMRRQLYFDKLHSTCSVSNIYGRQFYRLRRNIFKRNPRPRNKFPLSPSTDSLNIITSDSSSNTSESENEEADWIH